MKRLTAVTILIASFTLLPIGHAAAQHGQHAQKQASGLLSGHWTMTVDSPHGAIQMSLQLRHDDTNVTGTLTSGMGERPMKGQYTDSTLSLESTDDASNQWAVTAKLTAAGALQGHLSASAGDMKFTAERIKDKK